MKKLKSIFLWYFMYNKRLLNRAGFVVILMLIPAMVLSMKLFMKGESGVLTVVLCAEDNNDPLSGEIINSFMEKSSIILYKKAESPEEAKKLLRNNKADAAWIFSDDLENLMTEFTELNSKNKPFITILEREDNIPLQISRTMMYGRLFPYLSYRMYKAFVRSEITRAPIDDNLLRGYYDKNNTMGQILELKTLNGGYSNENENINYLNAPVRGMLSLIIMLSGLAAAMLFLEDQSEGRYDWLPDSRRIIPAFGICLAAASLSGAGALAAIFIMGINTAPQIEILSMFIYLFAAAGLCTLLCVLLRSPGILGALLPFMMISMFALCPIFFNVKLLPAVRLLMPPNFYLRMINDPSYILYSFIYITFIYFAAIISDRVRKKKRAC